MKKFLTAFLCGAAVLLSAETLKEWKFEGDKISVGKDRLPDFSGREDSGR